MQHHQHIVELGLLLEALKIRHVVIAPGSRNAPLIQLFTSNKAFFCHSIVDERVAGYVALGMSRHLNQPVVVVTTSGTAVLNLTPSMAEAYHQHIPLIILTADRPMESIPQFNNQVVDQIAPFFNHSRGFYEFPMELRSEEELIQALSSAEHLFHTANTDPGGPVHVNLPLAEPLYQSLPTPVLSMGDYGHETYATHDKTMPSTAMKGTDKILVLAGMGVYEKEVLIQLEELSSSREFVVVAENIANLPVDRFISNPELVLAVASEEERRNLAPDFVIAFGGQVVSKRLRQFVQSLSGVETLVIEGDPVTFLKKINRVTQEQETNRVNEYFHTWKGIENRSFTKAFNFIESAPFCNLSAIQTILSSIPQNSVVHLGNSSTIRYAQLMPVRQDLTYFANRGTSGIDGCVSTAVGAAMVSDKLHILIVGDLSFVYDSNSLWNHNFPKNIKVIVMNDGGGGIFRLLNGPDRMDFFEEFSVTHHPVSLELLAQSFDRSFQQATNGEDLSRILDLLFLPDSELSILEVDTSKSENSRIFKEFFT